MNRLAKRLSSLLVLAPLAFSSGCITGPVTPVVPPGGIIFADISAPLDTDAEATTVGMKKGEATTSSVLGLVGWGDASTTAAAQAGGLTEIHHLDYRFYNILGIWQTYTTVAWGK